MLINSFYVVFSNRACAFFLQSEKVFHDKEKGVIVGGQNLVLQKVQRSDASNYSCGATNYVGSTRSRVLQLSVQCMY